MHVTVSDNDEPYDVIDATASTEPIEEYMDMSEENPPLQAKSPQRSVTVHKELSALAETSNEDLSSMNPNEAQLWMLNQMQKLVEKFADISTIVEPLPNKQGNAKLQEIDDDIQMEPPPLPTQTHSCSFQ